MLRQRRRQAEAPLESLEPMLEAVAKSPLLQNWKWGAATNTFAAVFFGAICNFIQVEVAKPETAKQADLRRQQSEDLTSKVGALLDL